MDLFLLHSLVVAWVSLGAARRLATGIADRLLASAVLAWGNLVATSLVLSLLHRLGDGAWFITTSAGLGALLLLALQIRQVQPAPAEIPAAKSNPWLLGAFIITLAPLALANLSIAYTYLPNHPESLTWHFPRSLYYIGQNSLAHFDAADLRQTHLPFNYDLLQVFSLIYGAPLQCLTLFNLVAWAATGLAAYRLCRLCAASPNAALVTCWLVLVAPPVIAQAASTTIELSTGAALLCAAFFFVRWRQTRWRTHALLGGLALGLAVGSDLGILSALPAAIVTGLAFAWQQRRSGSGAGINPSRDWIGAALITAVVGLPFIVINLLGKGPGLKPVVDFLFHKPGPDATSGFWAGLLPLPAKPAPLFILSEDSVGFGLIAPLFVLGAVYTAIRGRKLIEPAGWFAWLGLGWVLVNFLLQLGAGFNPRDYVPALLLASPAVAFAVMAAASSGRQLIRFACGSVVILGVLTAGWSTGIYLLRNTSRPLLPLVDASFPRPTLPALPLLLEYRLASQSRINIDSDGTNERIFSLMALSRTQRFTAHGKMMPDAYNVISRAGTARDAAFGQAGQHSSYTLIPIPAKRTSGVEFLATIGSETAARDYFGVGRRAGQTAPIDTNRCVLVTLQYEPSPSGGPVPTRFKVEGLNPEDKAQLVIGVEYNDRRTAQLATFTRDGETTVPLVAPFYWLTFKVLDAGTQAELASTIIRYAASAADKAKPIDPNQPTKPNSIFVTDAVLWRETGITTSDGLTPTEGPFPQWNLPFIRWARKPSVILKIPPVEHMAHLQLAFSVRLHSRQAGAVEVYFNGKLVEHFRIEGQATWLDQTLDLTPQPGENTVEFRDAPLLNEPDWLDYLARYPDVKNYLLANNVPFEKGAQQHYELAGRAEGRTLQRIEKPTPAPDSYYFMFRNIRLEGFKAP